MRDVHILFIDDDEDFLYLLERACEFCGDIKEISSAGNGAEALALIQKWLSLKSKLPQVICVDINMPIMNGFEFIEAFEKLKLENKELEDIILISFLTSSNNSEDREKALSHKNVHYLTKPVDFEDLQSLVLEMVA